MPYLFLLIILVPAADIGVLLFFGKAIGVLQTILFIILSGVVGAYLAKSQGLKTLLKAQEELKRGRMPGEAIIDGICILVGGTLLITPGFVTDFLGLLLLIPFTRRFFKYLLRNSFKKWINKGRIKIIK